MADYQDIRGLRVKYLSTDPSTTTAGEVWYNSTSGTLKASVLGTAAWSSGGNMLVGRANAVTFGIQTSAVFAGGHAPALTLSSETYDGTTWTEGENLGSPADYSAAAGVATAGIAFGGSPPIGGAGKDTQSYNGSTWSEENNLTTARYDIGGSGTDTAALAAGGSPAANTGSPLSEEWNGTGWTEGEDLGTGRYKLTQFGTQTASVAVGGDTGPADVDSVEEYNGASWSAGTVYPAAITYAGSAGTATAGLVFLGGTPSYGVMTNSYDGSTWSLEPSLANAGGRSEGCGTSAAALAASGGPPSGRRDGSEEWNGAVAETQTLTTS